MVDFFLLLLITGAGDELQSMKKGIFEMADAIVINKADGANALSAKTYSAEIGKSLHYFAHPMPVFSCSALENKGVDKIWKEVSERISKSKKNGNFQKRRAEQRLSWMHSALRSMLEQQFFGNTAIKKSITFLETEVMKGKIFPLNAARKLIKKI
jgi:LAO/AO transport system kinase